MSTYGLLMAAPALALLVWAALEDLRSRRIPNWLTFSLVLGGIGQSVAFGAVVPSQGLRGMSRQRTAWVNARCKTRCVWWTERALRPDPAKSV